MKRRRQKLQVSTFPFLAVLLSAMGSLIVVLLAVDQKARAAARAKAQREAAHIMEKVETEAAARRAEVERKREEVRADWERKRDDLHNRLSAEEYELQSRMSRLREQLAYAVNGLRSEQDQTGQLHRRLDVERGLLEGVENNLKQSRTTADDAATQSAAARALLTRMTKDVEQLERALKELKAARERDRQTYSVVPYRGRHGEGRRPLYVECAGNQLMFHPDRSALWDTHAADVRAEVERRFTRQKEQLSPADQAAYQPYLMVLVRPDGVASYYHLQGSLRGLNVEFGYEFIDADWLLDFPADDGPAKSQPWTTAAKSTNSSPTAAGTPVGTPLKGVPTASGATRPFQNVGQDPNPVRGGTGLGSRPTGFETTSKPFSDNDSKGTGTGGHSFAGGPGYLQQGVEPGTVPGILVKGTGSASSHGISELPPPRITSGEGPNGNASKVQGTANGSNHATAEIPKPADFEAATSRPSTLPTAPQTGVPNPFAPPPTPDASSGAQSRGTTKQDSLPSPDVPASSETGRIPAIEVPSASPRPGGASNNPAAPATGTPAKPQPPSDKSSSVDKPVSSTQPGTSTTEDRADEPARHFEPRLPGTPERRPQPMRAVNLNGDRDWLIYVECTNEGVMLYPSQTFIPLTALKRGPANPLQQNVQQMIDRRQAAVRPGEAPYRPQVRFLVRPESMRAYHVAYPALDAVSVPMTRYNLKPEDDVLSIVTGK